jgi:hypothetical protein
MGAFQDVFRNAVANEILQYGFDYLFFAAGH